MKRSVPAAPRVPRKATMSDVAREAGVSLSTVDRVLNGRAGVADAKAAGVFSAARRLGLDRALVHRPSRTLRVGVLIQPPLNPFHAALREGIGLAARLHVDCNLQFLIHHVDPNAPARIAALIRERTPHLDGLIATLPDDARIAAALGEAARQMPVVTVADDVPGSGRAAFVGPDDFAAGRVAGDLMGRFLGRGGGKIVMIAGLRSMVGHRERERGFRAVLRETYPSCELSEVLESREDPDRSGTLVAETLGAGTEIRGVYLATTGASSVVEALRRLGRSQDVALIVHELTEDRRRLLRIRAIDAVVDQNPVLEGRMAAEIIARLLSRLTGESAAATTELRIFTPENA